MNKSRKWNLNWTRISMVKDFNFLVFSSSNQMNQLPNTKTRQTNEKKPSFGNPKRVKTGNWIALSWNRNKKKCCTRGRKLYNNFTNCRQPRDKKLHSYEVTKVAIKRIWEISCSPTTLDDPSEPISSSIGKDVIFISQMETSDSDKKCRLPLKLGREEVRVRGLEVGWLGESGGSFGLRSAMVDLVVGRGREIFANLIMIKTAVILNLFPVQISCNLQHVKVKK